jgi:hypothetical protein
VDVGSRGAGESVGRGRVPWATLDPQGRHRRPRGVPRPKVKVGQDDDAIEPISRLDQAVQDLVLAFGPCVQGVFIVTALPNAHVISHAQSNYSLALVALPVAVAVWHLFARPPLPPPASRARRALTRAAVVLTLILAVAAIAVTITLITRHTAGVFRWWPITPFGCTFLTIQAAQRAKRRYEAPPDQAAA